MLGVCIVFSLISCANKGNTIGETNQDSTSGIVGQSEHRYTPEMVVNKTDFTCGMPTSAGIKDTAHYKGNAYGFCSPECKAEFQVDPSKYITKK